MFSGDVVCGFCGSPISIVVENCPHCGRPSLFPNVRIASSPDELTALGERYEEAIEDARKRGCEAIVRAFEGALETADLVLCRPLAWVEALAFADNEVAATYLTKVNTGISIPTGDQWDRLRGVSGEIFFGAKSDRTHFAALSLTGYGLDTTYGECSITLRPAMVAHRTSFFQENSARFVRPSRDMLSDSYEIPRGYRADWENRRKLCIAKLAAKMTASTLEKDFPSLLLSAKDDGGDEFVEGHIWGPLTVRSMETIRIRKWSKKRYPRPVEIEALRETLVEFGVALEVPS